MTKNLKVTTMPIPFLLEKEDKKIKKKIFLYEIKIDNYLQIIDDFDEKDFSMQRTFLGFNSYKRLILDMILGADIPSIALVAKNKEFDGTNLSFDNKFLILDGLQRTSCIKIAKDILENPSNKEFDKFFNEFSNEIERDKLPTLEEFLNYNLSVFIWENLELKDMLYKMVVLNTGQRKMSNEHQLDILASEIKENLQSNEFELITEKEKKEKNLSSKDISEKGNLMLNTLSEAVVSYIKDSPVKNKSDAVEFLFERLTEYQVLLNKNLMIDLSFVLKIHKNFYIDEDGTKKYLFSLYEPLLVGFLSAVGKARKVISNEEEIISKLEYLENNILENDWEVFMDKYSKFKSAIGYKRRQFAYTVFLNYFMGQLSKLDFEMAYSRAY